MCEVALTQRWLGVEKYESSLFQNLERRPLSLTYKQTLSKLQVNQH